MEITNYHIKKKYNGVYILTYSFRKISREENEKLNITSISN